LTNPILGTNLLPCGGEAYLVSEFLTPPEADRALAQLLVELPWEQKHVTMYGKVHPVPRLTAWSGDVAYKYSGVLHEPAPWSPTLEGIRERVSQVVPRPNGVLGNLYRDGTDTVGYHADNEKVFGPYPIITSISLGAERRFILQLNEDHGVKVEMLLPHGSLLVMAGETQTKWKHTVPPARKSEGVVGTRVNLTFRKLVD
jgi:alkylated DNA repair dioxygenase AlkB